MSGVRSYGRPLEVAEQVVAKAGDPVWEGLLHQIVAAQRGVPVSVVGGKKACIQVQWQEDDKRSTMGRGRQ